MQISLAQYADAINITAGALRKRFHKEMAGMTKKQKREHNPILPNVEKVEKVGRDWVLSVSEKNFKNKFK